MYKDLSLKEKAKVIREGVRLGLNSIDDILNLYDDAIGHKFLGDTLSKINRFKTPEEILAERYEVEPIVSDNTNVILKPVFTPQEKSYAAALQAFYERHKSSEAEEKALREARLAVKDLKAAEFGTLDTPQSSNLLYAWRRFNNSKGSELLYPLPGIGEAMFGVDVADKLYSGNYGDAAKDLALYGVMTYTPEIADWARNNIEMYRATRFNIPKTQYESYFDYARISAQRNAMIGDNYYHGTFAKPYNVIWEAGSYQPVNANFDKGMFVSFGLPWGERINSRTMYIFPESTFGRRLATDYRGNIRLDEYINDIGKLVSDYDAGRLIYNIRNIHNNPRLSPESFRLADYDFTTLSGIKGEFGKYGNLKLDHAKDIFTGNQTVIPKEQFNSALLTKPYRIHYAEGPNSALIEFNPNAGKSNFGFSQLAYENFVDDFINGKTTMFSKGGPIVTPYGLWQYPGRDTIIPSNNITMDNVNYPVLGISDTGDTKVMMPWNDYKFRGSIVYEHPLINNQFQLGGNTKPTFDLWYPTVPKQKNDTSSYDLRRAYNTLPFDEMEKFRTIDDYHLPSVAYDEKTDTYTFLKRNGHPTLSYELYWYNSGSPDALEFRERYKLDTLSLPWRYVPRTYLEGGKTLNYLNVPEYNIALYNSISPLGDFPNLWEALAYKREVKDKLKNGNIYERDYKVGDTLGEKTAMAAWAKRLGIPYDEQDLPVYNGDTVTLPYSLVLEIPYDTNVLKNRIQLNKALLEKYSKYRYSDVVDAAIKADLYNLDKLRETYKTGKPVGLTEFGWNSRLLVNNGEIIPIENIQSPLNVLGNYNVRYSPEERRLYYSDEYDFNQFENFVPGEPFRIRGYIDLDNNKALGGNLFKKGGIYIKPENRGKFTALKKRTGHSASWFKAHGTPALKKMATFALNSRHWKHNDGGYLYSEGGFLLAPYLYVE